VGESGIRADAEPEVNRPYRAMVAGSGS
jgi:hypothetical protein